MLPDAGIYLDGELLPDEARAAMRLTMPREAAAPLVHPPPEPEKLRDYAETLQRAFEDVRQGYVQSLRDFQDCARRFSEMWIERERQFADEAARQRELTHRSLADVDLLGRSVLQARTQQICRDHGLIPRTGTGSGLSRRTARSRPRHWRSVPS